MRGTVAKRLRKQSLKPGEPSYKFLKKRYVHPTYAPNVVQSEPNSKMKRMQPNRRTKNISSKIK